MAQLDSHALRLFVAVAEELHFGRAAQALGMSQPPLSQQIRKLEARIGGPLFLRAKRSVQLTALGEALLDDARDVLNRIEQLSLRAQRLAQHEGGELRVAYISTALDELVAPALALLKSQQPNAQVDLQHMRTVRQLDALRRGSIHLGIGRLFEHDANGLTTQVVWRERYVLVVPAGDALASASEVRLFELRERPLLTFRRAGQEALYDRIMASLARAGVRPQSTRTVDTKQEIVALARAGLGVGIVPQSSARGRDIAGGVAFLPIVDELPPVELSAIYARHRSSLPLEQMLACIVECGQRQ